MTVRELIKILQNLPEESKDAAIFFRENETVIAPDKFILVKEADDE